MEDTQMRESYLRQFYRRSRSTVFCLSTMISPTLNTRLRYRYLFKKKLNLKEPKTFNEKLLWLKLKRYNRDPLVIQCADKFRVREYVRDCGQEHTLTKLLGVWDSAKQITWQQLPEKFVLKWNFGAGMNIICTDKASLDIVKVTEQMDQWRKNKYWLPHSEMQYKYMPKKIICEEYLQCSDSQTIPDYKVYCFHGKPLAILVMHDRGSDHISTEFFDVNWNPLANSVKYTAPTNQTKAPACLTQMVQTAKKLSEPFPFVRCDFYVVDGKLYFGELTFTPAGGMYTSTTTIDGKDMTEYLNVP